MALLAILGLRYDGANPCRQPPNSGLGRLGNDRLTNKESQPRGGGNFPRCGPEYLWRMRSLDELPAPRDATKAFEPTAWNRPSEKSWFCSAACLRDDLKSNQCTHYKRKLCSSNLRDRAYSTSYALHLFLPSSSFVRLNGWSSCRQKP